MSRRRLARLLDRFSLFIFGPYVETWEAWPQERIDAATDAALEGWERRTLDHVPFRPPG